MNAVAVYERVLFAPRASAPWIRGRELGFETWERTNTDIYKHGICPKIYTAGFFRLKILHHQFHLILTVFSGKKHKKKRENGGIYTAGKSFTLLPAWTNLTSEEADWVFHFRQIDHQALDSNFVIKSLSTWMETSSPPIF